MAVTEDFITGETSVDPLMCSDEQLMLQALDGWARDAILESILWMRFVELITNEWMINIFCYEIRNQPY